MVFQWGPGFCRSPGSNCNTPSIVSNKFTIHGLWPSNHSEPQPNECIKSNAKGGSLDPAKLPTKLITNLMTSWPSYRGTSARFWKDQWSKHGTCSFNRFDQIQYFNLAFNNWSGMGLYDLLKSEKIEPGTQNAPNTYDKNKFIEAIKKHRFKDEVTVTPLFYCNNNIDLTEIRMCLDDDGFQYMNCTGTSPKLMDTCGQQIEWYK
ncbi:hypothetical protein TSUD_112280 [Trifolium subterraneum]|uniref:Uncharacterized protein n=1 Tax=Trifolium subterraneum TaxID=3900 RepID=A0A2Z6NKC5_TRISU|nr:hypothetical protein TSUD_112280 [Trifolium subterraneum]